jgi:hypothetical protein
VWQAGNVIEREREKEINVCEREMEYRVVDGERVRRRERGR